MPVDATGLTGTWALLPTTALGPRTRRWVLLAWLLAVAVVLGGVVAVIVDSGVDGLLGQVLGQVPVLLVPVAVSAVAAVRRPLTRVDEHGVTTRQQWARPVTTPWADVAAVRPGSRWDPTPVLVLTDGSTRPLPGLPEDVAVRLAAAVARARPGAAPPSPAPRPAGRAPADGARPPLTEPPADDEGMDGPFQRSPRR